MVPKIQRNPRKSAKKDRRHADFARRRFDSLFRHKNVLFLLAVAVTAHELVHAAGGIDELLLTGEEGV